MMKFLLGALRLIYRNIFLLVLNAIEKEIYDNYLCNMEY